MKEYLKSKNTTCKTEVKKWFEMTWNAEDQYEGIERLKSTQIFFFFKLTAWKHFWTITNMNETISNETVRVKVEGGRWGCMEWLEITWIGELVTLTDPAE